MAIWTLPVVAGLPWLASVVTGAIGSVAGYLSIFLTKRLAMISAAIAVLGTLTVALFAAIDSAISSIYTTIPSELLPGISHVIPANMSECISALVAVRMLKYLYDWQVKFTTMKLF